MAAEEKRKKREQMKLEKQQVRAYQHVSLLENPPLLQPLGDSGAETVAVQLDSLEQPRGDLLFYKKQKCSFLLICIHSLYVTLSFSVPCMT